MSEYFLGVDSGTQGTKAIIIHGGKGNVVGSGTASHTMRPGLKDGEKEQDPKTWIRALEKAIKQALADSKVKASQVKGIGVSGQQHGFVPLDEKGEVIRPAKLWCDTSTAGQAENLVRKIGNLKKYISLTGNGLPPGFTASKILWLKQVEPKNYSRLATVLLPHDYLNYYLTKRMTMEAGDASGTGLLDIKTRDWQRRVVVAIDPALGDKLPPVQPSSEPAGKLDPMVARRLGLDAGTLVSAGGGDNMMGAIGTGNTKVGVVTASLGTSGTIYAYSSRPVIDPNGEVAAFCDSTGAWLPLVCTMNVTVATELVKKAFRWDNAKLTKAVESVAVGSDGMILLPYFEGERTPNLPSAKAAFFGIDSNNFTSAHMARATMEGVAMGLNYGLDRIKDLGIRPKQIRVTGGGSNNAAWRQILADVFEAEVIGLATTEGAAYGAAVQAKWCYALQRGERVRIQQITDAFVKTDPSTKATPKKDHTKQYRLSQEFFNQATRANVSTFAEHVAIR